MYFPAKDRQRIAATGSTGSIISAALNEPRRVSSQRSNVLMGLRPCLLPPYFGRFIRMHRIR